MSDYIKRSGLAEEVIDAFCDDCKQCGGHCRHDDLVEVIEHLPIISETEIIRKAFERVVERLEEKTEFLKDCTKYGNKNAKQQEKSYSNMMMYEVADLVEDLVDIVKEEGGIE